MAQRGGGENGTWTEEYLKLPQANDRANSPLVPIVPRRVKLGISHTFYILHFNQILSYNKISFFKPVISGFKISEEYIQTSHTHMVIQSDR